jgi:hypothetical protein
VKCSKCHSLERVFAEPKSEDGWEICVARMIEKSPLWITPEEGTQILDEIVRGRKDVVSSTPQKKYNDAQMLFIDRCTKCHSVNRILIQDKTREEWLETVLRMRDNAPKLFLEEDIPVLTEFLAERGRILRDDSAARVMVDKCLVCHEGGRILLERKTKKDWENCVTDMRDKAREKLNKSWFSNDEFRLIVDLLVRTQGL